MASLPCNSCGSSDGVEPYENGDFCFVCHKVVSKRRLQLTSDKTKQKNPKKIQLITVTDYWINWLKARGVNEKTIRAFDLQYDQLSNSIAYPLKVENEITGYQLRDENKKIKTVRYAKDDQPFLFECCSHDSARVVVVEDPVSAMRVWQDGDINTIALLGTNLNAANKLYLIEKYKKIIVWMDGDLAGYKAAQKIINDCSQFCCTSLVFTRNDPKDLNASEIKKALGYVYE